MARSALRDIIQSIHRKRLSVSENESKPETPITPYSVGEDPFSGKKITKIIILVTSQAQLCSDAQ